MTQKISTKTTTTAQKKTWLINFVTPSSLSVWASLSLLFFSPSPSASCSHCNSHLNNVVILASAVLMGLFVIKAACVNGEKAKKTQVPKMERVNLLSSKLERAEVDSRLWGGIMSDRAFPSALSLCILPRVLCICPLVALRRPFLSRYVCVDGFNFTICFRPKGMENKPPQLPFEDMALQWCVN